MKYNFIIISIVLQLIACSNPIHYDNYAINIHPSIGRATDLNFEDNDRIGLSIHKDKETYINNSEMVYDNGLFHGNNIFWYDDLMTISDVIAYYPYNKGGMPTQQNILRDQTQGFESCDIISAFKNNVLPTTSSLSLTFKHIMSKITIAITNETNISVVGVDICGSIGVAKLNLTQQSASAIPNMPSIEINSCAIENSSRYMAILAPQTVALTFNTNMADGSVHTTSLKETLLASGYEYAVVIKISGDGSSINISGEIDNWPGGGDIN